MAETMKDYEKELNESMKKNRRRGHSYRNSSKCGRKGSDP